MAAPRRFGSASLLLVVLVGAASCVNVDPKTGATKPRGDQKYSFSTIEKKADQLRKGMSKLQVMTLLGSPAERDRYGNEWVYLPERPGVLIPASALKLEFADGGLTEWGYHPIVLGSRL